MVTVKITVEFERDGAKHQHELTRDEAEALHAELGAALGRGFAFTPGPVMFPHVPVTTPFNPLDPPFRVTCDTSEAPNLHFQPPSR